VFTEAILTVRLVGYASLCWPLKLTIIKRNASAFYDEMPVIMSLRYRAWNRFFFHCVLSPGIRKRLIPTGVSNTILTWLLAAIPTARNATGTGRLLTHLNEVTSR
jgi:hypothetical protein